MLLPGVLVIDTTDRLGWFAGRILADLGAEVIKVESPGSNRASADWRAFNVNKRVLETDPARSTDRAQLDELIAQADICLITPTSSAGYETPEALRARHPRLVVVAITPFGLHGPRKEWRATDLELMAAGGAMFLAGEPDGVPLRVSEPQSYSWVGTQAAIGTLAALFRRDLTGLGDLVDVSAQASVVTAIAHAPAFYDLLGEEQKRAGAFMVGRSIKGAKYRVFWPCVDGWLNFIFYGGVAGRRTNEQLVAWMRERGASLGTLGEIDWSRWDPTRATQAEVNAIEAPVLSFFATLTKREFLLEAHKREMLGYPVSTVADVETDPQLAAREFFVKVSGADGAVESHCGSFAVVDGKRLPLRYPAGARFLDAAPPLKRAGGQL